MGRLGICNRHSSGYSYAQDISPLFGLHTTLAGGNAEFSWKVDVTACYREGWQDAGVLIDSRRGGSETG